MREKISKKEEMGSCYVLGTNIPSDVMSIIEIIDNYSEQQNVERGFRFLRHLYLSRMLVGLNRCWW
jgi:transposase